MRETQFIKQHEEKWSDFEEGLTRQDKNADNLQELFVEVTDDLSYSRTFYPNRSVRVYLNNLAQSIYLKLYRSRRSPVNQLKQFWTEELPLEIYAARYAFRLAFFLFFLSLAIGMLSCAMDPEFVEVILGESYVEMTRTNIENGDPMAVYKQKGRFDMFLGITFNNIYVAFLAFSMGVFFGLGSIVILISNAVMVGCFQYFFVQEGLFLESFLTIWIHGTLEISAIVIATAAGITMGRGPAFPGTYTRLQAFQQSARRGGKIMLGTVPLFILAGFFEGFLTRATETPEVIRGLFILICFLFVVGYFIWYPWYVANKQGALSVSERDTQRIPTERHFQLQTGLIKSNGEILGEMFTLLRRHFGMLFSTALLGTLGYCLIVFTLSGVPEEELFPFLTNNFDSGAQDAIIQFFYFLFSWLISPHDFVLLFSGGEERYWVALAAGGLLYALAWISMRSIHRELGQKTTVASHLWLVVTVGILFNSIGYWSWWVIFGFLFGLPLAALQVTVAYTEELPLWQSAGRTLSLLAGNFWKPFVLNLVVLVVGLALFSIVNSLFIDLFFMLLNWIIAGEQAVLNAWTLRITTFLLVLIASFVWIGLFLSIHLLYFSLREIKEATGLRAELELIGQQKRLRGLERE